MNLRRTMSKLQTALCKKGVYVKINQQQHYSEKAERMVTKYMVRIPQATETGEVKEATILETYQTADVVKKLAELYGGV